MKKSNAPKEHREAKPQAAEKAKAKALRAKERLLMSDKYKSEGFRSLAAAKPEHKPLSKQSERERNLEIEKLDVELPEENYERFEIRSALHELEGSGVIEADDIPYWVARDADGESLYNLGWTAPALKESVIEWKRFIKEYA